MVSSMLLNQETLKFVFGMKLRGLRLDKGLSLKDLAKKSGLSPSYINEIEKGKKYPKSEKILILAQALNEKYDDLVSLELKRDLQLVQNLLDKKFLTGIPFELFGIPAGTIFELLAEKPKEMQGFVGTILEVARSHNITTDDFQYALLRAYIGMHDNYFSSLEKSAKEFAKSNGPLWNLASDELKEKLIELLKNYKVSVAILDLTQLSPEFDQLHYYINRNRELFISSKLDEAELLFILARELGYRFLGFKERTQSSLMIKLDSFDQLYNHFAAGYFANSLLIPEDEIKSDLKKLFNLSEWEQSAFEKILARYHTSHENFLLRVSQMLPKHFALKQLFFLRYEYDFSTKRYEISQELHLSDHHDPHKVTGNEHYCSRWLIHRLTQRQAIQGKGLSIGVQRSTYVGTENEYLIIGSSSPKLLSRRSISSVCIGILMNGPLQDLITWATSKKIPSYIVGETCERCTYKECTDRQAPIDPSLDPEKNDRVLAAIESLNKASL